MFILYYVSFSHLPEHLDACVCVFGARLDVVSVSHETKMEIIMQMHLQRIEKSEKQNKTRKKSRGIQMSVVITRKIFQLNKVNWKVRFGIRNGNKQIVYTIESEQKDRKNRPEKSKKSSA